MACWKEISEIFPTQRSATSLSLMAMLQRTLPLLLKLDLPPSTLAASLEEFFSSAITFSTNWKKFGYGQIFSLFPNRKLYPSLLLFVVTPSYWNMTCSMCLDGRSRLSRFFLCTSEKEQQSLPVDQSVSWQECRDFSGPQSFLEGENRPTRELLLWCRDL